MVIDTGVMESGFEFENLVELKQFQDKHQAANYCTEGSANQLKMVLAISILTKFLVRRKGHHGGKVILRLAQDEETAERSELRVAPRVTHRLPTKLWQAEAKQPDGYRS
jgi:hypothetical protein